MEDRIKNLSLDQKAKLYYMALLQKGVIDTLPEDPKAAYVQSMMDEPASSKFSEPMGETNDPEDDAEQAEYDKGWYGESSDYADRLANSGTDSDGRNTWGDKTGYSDEEMAQGKGKLKKYPDKDGRNVWGDKTDYSDAEKKAKAKKMAQMAYDKAEMNGDIRGMELALAAMDIDKPIPGLNEAKITKKSLKEIASQLGYLKEIDLNAISAKKASFVYTEQGGRFYSLTLSTSDGQTLKMKYDEANEWLKDTLAYIHEGDLLPRRYNSGLEDLDLIVARLEELGIEASHGDYMDVS